MTSFEESSIAVTSELTSSIKVIFSRLDVSVAAITFKLKNITKM